MKNWHSLYSWEEISDWERDKNVIYIARDTTKNFFAYDVAISFVDPRYNKWHSIIVSVVTPTVQINKESIEELLFNNIEVLDEVLEEELGMFDSWTEARNVLKTTIGV